MITTTVIHIRHAPEGWESNPQYKYCGRPYDRGKYHLAGSVFANPFMVDRDGNRGECIEKFEHLILNECRELFDQARMELPGKVLMCWCKPNACHCDTLAAIADGKLQFQGAVHAEV